MPLDHEGGQVAVSELDAIISRRKRRNMFELFPDAGPLAFDKYPKHMELFRAGHDYMERCFLAANRIGKTMAAGYEVSCHLSGWYPWWWRGRRFSRPVSCIMAGRTIKTTRDILQRKMLGHPHQVGARKRMDGTGLLPLEWIGQPSWSGSSDLVDTVPIKCLTGGYSMLKFRSYEQGAGAFEGTEEDVIAFDEEPPMDVYGEALIRLTSTTGRFEDNGIMILTFTPLLGYSEVVMQFMPEDMRPLPLPEINEDFYADQDGVIQ